VKKILTIIGNRPQFIKHFLISREIRKTCSEYILHTGQHYDYELSKIFFDHLEIPEPDENMNVGSGSHAYQTSKILVHTEEAIIREKPDMALVYGDTNSTLGAALAAAKLNVPVAHVEAGPRTYNFGEPEELNRVLTDHASALLLAPTLAAARNLEKENLYEKAVLTGDVMLDTFLAAMDKVKANGALVGKLDLDGEPFIAVTVHRPHNTDCREPLEEIVRALADIDKRIIFPVHPRTASAFKREKLDGLLKAAENVSLIDPVGYIDMLTILTKAESVITDSGGLQKEAFFAGKRCVSLNEVSPWPTTVRAGFNFPIPTRAEKIKEALKNSVPETPDIDIFGDGKAHIRIVNAIKDLLSR